MADWLVDCLEEIRSRPPAPHALEIFRSDSVARRGLADADSDRKRPV